MKKLHILFTGKVQGVYFRATCLQFAKELNLVGRVRNLLDGRVELWVSGPEAEVDRMLEKLDARFEIQEKEVEEIKKLAVWDDFQITRSDGDEDPFG